MTGCPGELELSRAVGTGAPPALAAHLATCASCRDTSAGLAAAIELARELPVDVPAAAHREEVRTALLAAASGIAVRGVPRRGWLVPAIALVAAAAVVVAMSAARSSDPVRPARVARGTIRPHADARFTASTATPDEIVRLSDGTIDIEVQPLAAGERFRVVVGHDEEVEVRGTEFAVTAADDHLVAVSVVRGRVEVRATGEEMTVLEAGQRWHVEIARAEPPVVPAPVAPAPVAPGDPPRRAPAPASVRTVAPARVEVPEVQVPVPAPAPPVVAPDPDQGRAPEELAYDDGWDAMRGGEFRRAAIAFGHVVALSPDGELADDAAYWRAVATARIPRPAEAITAFHDFLEDYPGSAHRGEASAMLGWLLLDAHQLAEAERLFRATADDPSHAVRTSARAGLDELARRK